MRKSIIVLIILLNIQIFGKKTELLAQSSFSMDTTFQPFFDLRQPISGGSTSDLWENPTNGNLHIVGDFRYFIGNDPYYSILTTHRDGSRNFNYIGFNVDGMTFFYPINDSVFISGSGGGLLLPDGHRWKFCMDHMAAELSSNGELFSGILSLFFSEWVFFNDQ